MSEIIIKRSLRELLPKGDGRAVLRDEGGGPIGRGPMGPGVRFKPRKMNLKLYGSVLALVVLLAGGYVVSKKVAQATIVVRPRQEAFTIDVILSAGQTKENQATSSQPALTYEVINIEDKESKIVPASGTEMIEKKASGKITVFNDYDEKPQKLIRNTRFETAEGKIFRVEEAIVVPGVKTEEDNRLPGTVDAIVRADEPGESYNIGKTEFTIPGLKGDPRFQKMYARSKTEMSGGFIGQIKKVSETDRTKVRDEIKAVLTAKLKKRVKDELPQEYLSFDDAVFLDYEEEIGGGGGQKEAELIIKGKLALIALDEKKLAWSIAVSNISGFDGSEVSLAEPEKLTFKLLSKESVNPDQTPNIRFSVKGAGKIIWQFDEDGLIKALAGKNKKEFTDVLKSYGAIGRAEAVFKPSWIKTFPSDIERIKIEKVIES